MRIGPNAAEQFGSRPFVSGRSAAAEAGVAFNALMSAGDQTAAGVTQSSPSKVRWGENDDNSSANEKVANDFLDWMKKDPIEKLRERILESKDLDERSLAALPPEQRKAIEAEISQAIKQMFGAGDASLRSGSDENIGADAAVERS
ncbi:MAG TPA: hypothetical protein VHO05_13870 [Hyphomicrobium sp.]|nr:hypothetical protein [Hyphomicrobium sp.]